MDDAERLEAYATKAQERILTRLHGAQPGGRNQALNEAAFALGQLVGAGAIDHGAASYALTTAAQVLGMSRAEAAGTIRSGLSAGVSKPATLPDGLDAHAVAPAPARTVPDKPLPDDADVRSFLRRTCLPVREGGAVASYLRDRGLPVLSPLRELPGDAVVPEWAEGWQRRHRLIVPYVGADGELLTVRARAIEAAQRKSLAPKGLAFRGCVMADKGGLRMLRGKAEPAAVWIVEGETDWIALAGLVHGDDDAPAVLGIAGGGRAGSWSTDIAARIPARARVVIATDHDDAGDRYAAAIAASLEGRDLRRWQSHEGPGDVEDRIRAGDYILIDHTPWVAPEPEARSDVPTEGHTDSRAAERLVEAHGDRIRHIGEWGRWLVWRGTHWEQDAIGAVLELSRQEAYKWTRKNAPADDSKAAKQNYARALGMESRGHVYAAAEMAAHHPRCAWSASSLDREVWLLPTQAGTVDLRTGDVLPSSPGHRFTACTPLAYDPDATAPTWERCLYEWMDGQQELIDFLRRWTGYSLTGSVQEHAMVVAIGSGRNGKGVYTETLLSVLGEDLAGQMAPGLLIASRNERHPTELFALRGKRFVVGSEVKNGARFDEERVKSLTGGDTITARRMREDFSSFAPTHKIVLACNRLPTVSDMSPGFWARFRVVPWDVSFEGREDRDLATKLRAELPGILAWAVRGAVEWYHDGLGVPAVVRAKTQAYRLAEDQIARYIEAIKQADPAAETEIGYTAFREWFDEQGERPMSARALAADLGSRGWVRRKSHGRMVWAPKSEGGVIDMFGRG